MNGWNGNEKCDAMNSYIDYKLSGGEKYTGRRQKKSGGFGCGVLIYIFFMIVFMAALPGVGLLMLVALVWYWMCGGL